MQMLGVRQVGRESACSDLDLDLPVWKGHQPDGPPGSVGVVRHLVKRVRVAADLGRGLSCPAIAGRASIIALSAAMIAMSFFIGSFLGQPFARPHSLVRSHTGPGLVEVSSVTS